MYEFSDFQGSQKELDRSLTKHARKRMNSRGLSDDAVTAALMYGRLTRTRGSEIYAIGRKEINKFKTIGIDLSNFDGVQVVCSSDGAVLTTYRNRDFRKLRPYRHHHRMNA